MRKAQEASRILGGTRNNAGRLLAAEAMELCASIDVAYDDLETGIGGLVGAASSYLEMGPAKDARRGLARVARTLSATYASIGMRDRSAHFALEYLRTVSDSDRDPFAVAWGASVLAAAGHPDPLADFARRNEASGYPEPVRSILMILESRVGCREYSVHELADAARNLAYVPSDLRLQCTLFAANELIHRDNAALAVRLLSELSADLAAAPVTDARILQALGVACARAGDRDASLQNYLLAWTRYDDLRYRVGSLVIRRGIDRELVRCRSGALSAAASRGDWRQLLELIESCRLQATMDVPGSGAELDESLETGVPIERRVRARRRIDVDTLPDVYQAAVGDLLDDRADLTGQVDIYVGGISSLAEARASDGPAGRRSRLDAEQVMRRFAQSDDLWWSSWYEHGVLYSVLSREGIAFDGGAVDLMADEDLREALSIVSLRYKIDPPWPVPPTVADRDLTHYLAVADSFEELHLTTLLARLLPATLHASSSAHGRLLIAAAPELAPVPWPILPLDPAASPVLRLVERFELRFVPSLAILDQLPRESGSGDTPLPFIFACDYLPAAGVAPPLPARRAQTTLAARDWCDVAGINEATSVNVTRFLRALPRGTEGVAFFRAHYEWVDGHPSSSGIALADGTLPSGIFGARDHGDGQTVVSLPTTVVMSCCSTSGARERNGGETLGLAPLALLAGASRLIVTSVEIRHTPFTIALDDMLIDLAIQPGDHFASLRALQLRLLDEWRRYSMRDVAALRDKTPMPDIWAHYQAFGG